MRVYVAPGSPCSSIYVPAFPRTAEGPPPFVPRELSSEELWRAADTVRQLVEADPEVLPAVRAVLQNTEDELWSEADDVLTHPARWAETGSSWGERALHALSRCIPS
jgi:dipeptidase